MPLAPSLDKVGPMGRTVTDVAIVLEAIAGYDRRDPGSARGHGFRRGDVEAAAAARARRGATGPGAWRSRRSTSRKAPTSRCVRCSANAMARFEGLGVEFVEAELPPELPYYKIIEGVVFGEGSASFRELIESDRLELVTDDDQRAKLRETLSMPADVYLDAMRDRERVRAAFDAIFRGVDAIFTYTLPWEPHPIVGEFTPVNPTKGFTGMVAASNLADLPAVFLPVGLTENQLPVGVQLVGPKFSEATLVALGEQFQAATDFHALRPPMDDAEPEPVLAMADAARAEAGLDEQAREPVDPGSRRCGPGGGSGPVGRRPRGTGRDPAAGRAPLGGADRPAGAGAAVHARLGRGAMTAWAAELARRVRAREVRVADVAEETLDAIRREDDVIRAFTAVDEDAVRRDARRLDRRLADGADLGPLAGVPIAIKDLIDVRGLPTSYGSAAFDPFAATSDATVVRRLRAAGALIVGKVRTTEFAWSQRTLPTLNPLDHGISTGGSSSGPAAAIASGQVPVALGTDTGGSIRIPAVQCGLVGIKPTFGVVGRGGVLPANWTLDTVGPLATTCEDARLVLAAIVGPDARDPWSARPARLRRVRAELAAPARRPRPARRPPRHRRRDRSSRSTTLRSPPPTKRPSSGSRAPAPS